MSELEEKLEGILGNPQAMAQIMSLAQSLNSGGAAQQSNSEPRLTASHPALPRPLLHPPQRLSPAPRQQLPLWADWAVFWAA